jgi:LysM repeat protein
MLHFRTKLLATVILKAVSIVDATTCGKYHTIKSGDTCYDIAASNDFTIAQLLELNPTISSCSNLVIGANMCIDRNNLKDKSLPWLSTCNKFHQIASGDTCYAISQKYSITLQQIQQFNPIIDCWNLIPKRHVCINIDNSGSSTDVVPKTCLSKYTVKSGDTCFNIAIAHHMSYQYFKQQNLNLDCILLLPGKEGYLE